MSSPYGQWANGPIDFDNAGVISQANQPPSALSGPVSVSPAPSPGGGGVSPGFAASPSPQSPVPGRNPAAVNRGGGGGGASVMPGFDPSTGASMSFDEGGEVNGVIGADQGTDQATLDPMAAVKQALQFGRQKFGLPGNLTSGEADTQSFDDGGVIQAQPEQGQGQQPVDPRQAMSYLTGADNISPEVASALEQHADPQGAMSPGQRTMAAIAKAPNAEAAFGYLQHKRTQYNAYAGGARAALDKGNLAQAAVNATQAFAAVPTGADIQFAPARGGIAIRSKSMGGQPNQPAQQAAEDGGVIDQYADLPDSENIEDRRPEGAGNQSADTYEPALAKQRQLANDTTKDQRRKVRGKTAAYDDGGVVEEDDSGDPEDVTAPVTEDTGDTSEAGDDGQTTVLTPQQFHALMQGGYDAPLDQGWGQYLGSILASAGGPGVGDAGHGKAASMATQPGGAGPQQPSPTTSGADPAVSAALQADQQQQAPQQPGAASGMGGQASRIQQSAPPDQSGDERVGNYQQRIEAVANKLFRPNSWYEPGSAQEQQRTAYIAKQMEGVMGSEHKIDQEHARNRGMLEQLRTNRALEVAGVKDAGAQKRAELRSQTQLQVAQARNLYGQLGQQQREQVRLVGQQIAANPGISPAEANTRMQALSKQIGLDPHTVDSMIKGQVWAPPQQGGQQPPQQQAPPQGGQQGGGSGQKKYVVYPSGPYAGQRLEVLPNGKVKLPPTGP